MRVVAGAAWYQFIREKQAVFWTLLFPLVFIVAFRVGFGDAIDDASPVEVTIVDLDQGVEFDLSTVPADERAATRAGLVASGPFAPGNGSEAGDVLTGSHASSLAWMLADLRWPDAPDVAMFDVTVEGELSEAEAALEGRETDVVLVLPPGYSANVSGGEPEVVEVLLDPSTGGSLAGAGTLQQVLAVYHAAAGGNGTVGASTGGGPDVATRSVASDGLSGFDYLAPGIIVFGTTSLATSVATALAAESQRGTLDRLRATAVSGPAFQLGHGLVWALIGMVQFAILIGVAILLGMKVSGDTASTLALAFAAGTVGVVASVGLGLIIAAFVANENLAGTVGTAAVLPISFLIGAFFPLELAWLKVLPWERMLAAERGVLLFEATAGETAVLIAQGLAGAFAMVGLGAWLYHRRMLRPEVA